MKRFLALAMAGTLAFAGTAFARPALYWEEAQALTRTIPSGSSRGTDNEGDPMGLDLSQVRGLRVSVCAESGQTLSGAGTLHAVLFHADKKLWMRGKAVDISVDVSGSRCEVWDFSTALERGDFVMFAADSVTVSGGTTVTVRVDGQPRMGP